MAIYAIDGVAPTIADDVFVHPQAVVIGDVTIGAGSSIWPCAVLRGDEGGIVVGARTSIQDGAVIHTTAESPTTIGDDCVIGHLAHLEGCTIENGSLVGSNSVVLHNAVVRSGALVGASAVVSGGTEVPSGAMALGVPAKIRPDTVEPGTILENAEFYVQRGAQYRSGLTRLD